MTYFTWDIYIRQEMHLNFLTPSPRQASHLPPLTLKLNLFFSKPLIFASLVVVNNSLISSKTPVYVAGLLLGVLPIGFCEIATNLSIFSIPNIFHRLLVFFGLI